MRWNTCCGFPLTKNEDGTTKEWAYREMYQIATVHDNMPGLSSVEFVIDPETMRLYASSEKGTEKVVDISKNENVVMYWYKQIPEDEYVPQVNDYFNSYGVQIKGTARLMHRRGGQLLPRREPVYAHPVWPGKMGCDGRGDPARDHRPHRAGQRVD